jgi:NitT/TauT family transport system substrate-binding protein
MKGNLTARACGLLAGIAVACAVAACGDDSSGSSAGSASSPGGGTTGVRLSIVNGFGTLPIEVAVKKGLFAKHGLDVKVTSATDQSTFAPALGRQYDFIMGTPMDFFSAASRGIPVRLVATTQRNAKSGPNNILVSKDPAVKSVADLKGKRVGVVGLAGTSYASITYLLKQAGVDPKDVKFVPTPFPTMGDQLDAGRLDAAISAMPFAAGLTASGYRTIIDAPLAAMGENSPNTLFSTSPGFLKDHPQAAAQFRASLAESIAYIKANESESRQILQAWLKLPAAVAEGSPLPSWGDPVVTVDQMAPMVKVIESSGLVEGRIPDINGLVLAS